MFQWCHPATLVGGAGGGKRKQNHHNCRRGTKIESGLDFRTRNATKWQGRRGCGGALFLPFSIRDFVFWTLWWSRWGWKHERTKWMTVHSCVEGEFKANCRLTWSRNRSKWAVIYELKIVRFELFDEFFRVSSPNSIIRRSFHFR